jgi:hypothetical protein
MTTYTLTADYFATGEGRTIMVMLCQEFNGEEAAKARFCEKFGR